MHTLESLAVVLIAVGIAYIFPEHRSTVSVVAVTSLSALAKYARVSDDVPVPDYINGDYGDTKSK